MSACSNQLVEYNSRTMSVCNSDYALRNQPYLKPIIGFSMFLMWSTICVLLCIFLPKLYRMCKEHKLKVGSFIAILAAIIISLYLSINSFIYLYVNFHELLDFFK